MGRAIPPTRRPRSPEEASSSTSSDAIGMPISRHCLTALTLNVIRHAVPHRAGRQTRFIDER